MSVIDLFPGAADALAKEEAIIERGLATFFEVGHALQRIRDRELYRAAGFDGFVEYLNSKPWGIGQAEAYRQINASRVVEALGLPDPVNVAQAEVLAPLLKKAAPAVVQQVYAEAVEEAGGAENVTAKQLRTKVREILPPKPKSTKHIGGMRARNPDLTEVISLLKQAKKVWDNTSPAEIHQTASGKQRQDAYEFFVSYQETLEAMKTAMDNMRSHVD
jgi:hypothetical protein